MKIFGFLPQKVDFWGKKVAIYSNFVVVAVSSRMASYLRGYVMNLNLFWVFFYPTVDFACYSSKLEEFDTLTLTRPLIIIKQR